jgi:hypothetical protein
MCEKSGTKCNNSSFFMCRQEKSKMEVAYKKEIGNTMEINLRNITVNIGCSCVAPKLQFLNLRNSGPREKKK